MTTHRSCTAIGELLSACGYRVSLYETAKQLLAAPLNNGPACILLDVQMAGMTGPQLQTQLVDLGCQLPIVFLSAYGDVPTTVTTIKAGAEDFLTKPATKERLLEAIQRALARYEDMLARGKQISVSSITLCEADASRTGSVRLVGARKTPQANCL